MMKKIILIFLFFYAFLLNVCPSPTKNQTIRRHFIIAVDCSGTFQSDSDKYVLFDYFWNLIENNSINKNELSSADANSTSKCKITKCFCKSTPLVLRNSISFLVSH